MVEQNLHQRALHSGEPGMDARRRPSPELSIRDTFLGHRIDLSPVFSTSQQPATAFLGVFCLKSQLRRRRHAEERGATSAR